MTAADMSIPANLILVGKTIRTDALWGFAARKIWLFWGPAPPLPLLLLLTNFPTFLSRRGPPSWAQGRSLLMLSVAAGHVLPGSPNVGE